MRRVWSGLWAVAVCLSAACAVQDPLLQRDPADMGEAALRQYYDELGRAADACETRNNSPRVEFGLNSGGGGVSLAIPNPLEGGCDAAALRQRRVEVRHLMRQRGMEPLSE